MNNTFAFNHFNFNVKDLDRSLKFYKEAFGLEPVEVNDRPNFTLAFLGDNTTSFRLELTYLKDRTEAYDLGELAVPHHHPLDDGLTTDATVDLGMWER